MRINTKYSKWSGAILLTALLSLSIINYLYFSECDFLFKEPFLPNVYLCFIISIEVFAGLSQNRILKGVSYLFTMGLCGYIFIISVLCVPLISFLSEALGFCSFEFSYFILALCCGILSFSAAVSLLKLYLRADEG